LPRLESASFTGEYPIARVAFHDRELPCALRSKRFRPSFNWTRRHRASRRHLALSGEERSRAAATVSIAYSLRNPVARPAAPATTAASRISRTVHAQPYFSPRPTPSRAAWLPACWMRRRRADTLRGWPLEMWGWTPALLFWDDFSTDGRLGPETPSSMPQARFALSREIARERSHLHVRTRLAFSRTVRRPVRLVRARRSREHRHGNHYCTRFKDAWDAARHLAANLPDLERRTRAFMKAVRESTLPAEWSTPP
jgi:hypothetical protein